VASLSATLLLSITGIYFTYKFTTNVLSPVFLASLLWFCAYIEGVQYGLTMGHTATPVVISLGILSFGVGVSTTGICEKFFTRRELAAFRKSRFLPRFGKRAKIFYTSVLISTAILTVLSAADFLRRRYGDYDRKRAIEAEAYRNA